MRRHRRRRCQHGAAGAAGDGARALHLCLKAQELHFHGHNGAPTAGEAAREDDTPMTTAWTIRLLHDGKDLLKVGAVLVSHPVEGPVDVSSKIFDSIQEQIAGTSSSCGSF